jgi:hypothetical protein
MRAQETHINTNIALLAIATIGLERVNVIPWSGSFVQPYYLLAIPFLGYLWTKSVKGFGVFYVLLLCLMAGSLISNGLYEAYYWKKFIQVAYVFLVSYGLAEYLVAKTDTRNLVSGIKLFLLLNVAITFLQIGNFLQGVEVKAGFDSNQFINITPILIGDYFRISGYSLDANKGIFNFGYALIVLTLIADKGWLWLKVLYPLTFFAHSRSALLSMFPAVYKKSKLYAVMYIGLYAMVLIFLTRDDIFSDRFSMGSEVGLTAASSSNQTRLQLIQLWTEVMMQSSLGQIIFGHGFASAGLYLEKVLGTTYSDFASGYLTILYELGLAGMILIGTIFVRLWRKFGEIERSMLLLPLLIFQLFYANLAEPLILLILSYFYLLNRDNLSLSVAKED